MNESTARQKGYTFTGIYSRFTDQLKPQVETIRKAGYKAVIVNAYGGGYSVYTERRYIDDKYADDKYAAGLRTRLKVGYPAQEAQLRAEFEEKLATIEKQRQSNLAWLRDNGYSVEVAS